MKFLFPALCWAVLLGGFACAKHPAPSPAAPPILRGEPFQEDKPMEPYHEEHILSLESKPPQSPFYFDFDGYALKNLAQAAALAQYMKEHPRVKIHLAGYCSEEGPNDYNMALGARRAKTVRDYLDAAGVEEERIEWVSFGEESPVTHDLNQFHLNRRVEFTLSQP